MFAPIPRGKLKSN